jgi:signal transduction histidine kinase
VFSQVGDVAPTTAGSVLRSIDGMATEESYPKLISLAVHELRSPASVVGGYLRMLQRDRETPLSERHQKLVTEAEKSCARLVALIAELSEIGKIDDGLIALSQSDTDLFPLVAEVAGSVQEAAERGVRLEVRGQADGARMAGDGTRLRAALGAIFHALLREKPGPCLVVADRRVAQTDGQSSAVIVVADEAGVQAAYDAPAGAFDEKRGGVGLSLPIARRVIEAHGGRLWSPAFSKGSGEAGAGVFDERAARGTEVIAFPLKG